MVRLYCIGSTEIDQFRLQQVSFCQLRLLPHGSISWDLLLRCKGDRVRSNVRSAANIIRQDLRHLLEAVALQGPAAEEEQHILSNTGSSVKVTRWNPNDMRTGRRVSMHFCLWVYIYIPYSLQHVLIYRLAFRIYRLAFNMQKSSMSQPPVAPMLR